MKRTCAFLLGAFAWGAVHAGNPATTSTSAAIPWMSLGAAVGADYTGDGLAVTLTQSGARLHCALQQLDGEATAEGLWLTSMASNAPSERFGVTASEIVWRTAPSASAGPGSNPLRLAGEGMVSLSGQVARFSRPGLTEEYSVSLDGVRQDFLVERAPSNRAAGKLVVTLAVTGASVERAPYGARLVLGESGRAIAYSRVRAADATGRQLPARIEVEQTETRPASREPERSFPQAPADCQSATPQTKLSALRSGTGFSSPCATLALVVNDAGAVYPVRIDPTFSDANWVSMAGVQGTDAGVYAMAEDGAGNLYIGGDFTIANNVPASRVARWDGSRWWPLGSGIEGHVYALAVAGTTVYAGGDFAMAGGITISNIAQWNGSTWSGVGSGINGPVYALVLQGGKLYAGGDFTMAGGNPAECLAQWGAGGWSAVGTNVESTVYALAGSGTVLYAGGLAFKMGTNTADVTTVAAWNGTSWSALVGPNKQSLAGDPFALACSGATLYAGGENVSVAGTNGDYFGGNIAQWNGTQWSPLGSGMNDVVRTLGLFGGTLYAGGQFTTADGSTANHVAKWSGSQWLPVGTGMPGASDDVQSLAMYGSTLYAGGGFTMAGTNAAVCIAQWTGNNWLPMGSGVNGVVNALALSGSTLYAGGTFTTIGTNVFNYIVQWTGGAWSALGQGLNSNVESLAVSGGTLYAGGAFMTAGGTTANRVAQWNGTNWSALGTGMNSDVQALAVSGSTLYAGGSFTTAGAYGSNYIAQWNGANWLAVGGGMDGHVAALAVSGTNLYAGGSFAHAGTNAARINAANIAQWNGTRWSPLGSGMNSNVLALAVSSNTLYAGGNFTTAGSNTASYVAQWNGTNWSALGLGIGGANAFVASLAASGGTLYAGGYFKTAGGNAATNIAQWNSGSWSALGSGMGGFDYYPYGYPCVNALAVGGATLFAGGTFETAGTNVSSAIAEALVGGTTGSLLILTGDGSFGFSGGTFGFDLTGPSGSNVVVEASTNLRTWWPLRTNQLGGAPLYFSDAQSRTNSHRLYRAMLLP